jgi:arylsulfatase A-like enzyme
VPPERVPQPAPRHAAAFAGREAPRGGSFDEADVSDKPRAVRRRARLSAGAVAAIDEHHRLRLRTLLAVDELVERLFGALASRGELARTIFFYTSDNGFHLGQHRGLPGKGSPYEEDIRVPLVARGPGVAPGVREQLVLLSDLAPTIAELAGAGIPDGRDARSLVPLLAADAGPGRRAFLIQLWAEAPRAGPHWRGVRTATHKYVEWQHQGEVELYDLVADPHELANLAAGSPPPLVAALAARLEALAACRGDACRRLEDAPLDAPSAP